MVLLIGPAGCGHEDHLVNQPSEIRSEGVGAPKWAVARGDERLPIVLRSLSDMFRSVSKLGRDAGSGTPSRIGGRAYHGVVRFEVLGPTRVVAAVRAGTPTERPLPPSLEGPSNSRARDAPCRAKPSGVGRPLGRRAVGRQPAGNSPTHGAVVRVGASPKALGSVITREGAGYKIGVDANTCDILDFESRIGQRLERCHRPIRRVLRPRSATALALWRGAPFDDVGGREALEGGWPRLAELRLAAVEEMMHARLAAGQHSDVVADLDRLTRGTPLP